jgi:hypothetical protein
MVVGLPASGKSHFIWDLIAAWPRPDIPRVCDDMPPTAMRGLQPAGVTIVSHPSMCSIRPEMWGEILCDTHIMVTRYKWTFRNPLRIIPVFFENDPEQCLRNAATRPNRQVSNYIRSLSREYQIPSGVIRLPVFR